MKRVTLLIFLFYLAQNTFGQRRSYDSLKALLSIAKQDTNKVNLLDALSSYYFFEATDSLFLFADEGMKLADSLGYEKGVVKNKLNFATASWTFGDFPSAIQLSYSMLESPFVKSNSRMEGRIRALMINSYRDQGDYREALKWVDTVRFKLGILFAMEGSCYYGLKKYDTALLLLKRSLMFDESDLGFEGWEYLVTGRTYEEMGDAPKAFEFYHKAILDLKPVNNFKDLSGAYVSMGSLFLTLGKPDSTIYFGKQALAIAKTKKFNREMAEAYALLAKAYESINSRDALMYYKLSMEAKDNLYSQEKQRQIAGLKFSEHLKVKDRERERMSYENRIRTNTLMGSSFTLLIIALFLYRSSQQKQKAKLKIEHAYDQLKNTQAQLIQSEKMASLGELTAGIAHEIQNPLNFVNNFSELNNELIGEMKTELAAGNTERAAEIAADIAQNLEKINRHGKRADAIVKGMLQHSHTSADQKELTDLNLLCDEYVRLAYHGLRAKDKTFNARFETDFDAKLPRISVIPQDMGRVILNLINNAFYAVSARAAAKMDINYEPSVRISTKNLGAKIEIKVQDNGTGVPENVRDKIFQPFFTTKPTGQGTGLGLSLSYDIIKAHGGELKLVGGQEFSGSIFAITLNVI